MNKYKLIAPINHAPDAEVGCTVYEYTGCTYGLVSEDTHMTGIEHIAVTLKSDGDTPFFTAPIRSLVKL